MMLDRIGGGMVGGAGGFAARGADFSGRASDVRDTTRTAGRGSETRAPVRPGRGNGPAYPQGGIVTPGSQMPGFPKPPAAPAAGDGSGPYASRQATLSDHINEAAFYRVADAADSMGLDNAARHMRHYLGASGEVLKVDPQGIARDVPPIGREMDAAFETDVRQVAEAKVRESYTGQPMQFTIATPWTSTYATKELSQDWFFAVGGFSYAHTATVTVTPRANGVAEVHVDSNRHVFDRYNWDAGKGVDIGPIRVGDEQLGRMHEAGLAQEFEVRGTATGPSADFTVTPSGD